MKILKIYLDTSVIGGCFDEEFAEESNTLLDQIKSGKYTAVISDMTLKELEFAPDNIKGVLKEIPSIHLIEISVNDEIVNLANQYISEKVIPMWCEADALHIATATWHNADLLLSWNFKHIVNITRIKGYNSVNLKEGYKALEIRSPKEVIYDE